MLRRPAFLAGVAMALWLLVAWVAYTSLLARQTDALREESLRNLDALALTLEATLARHETLPGLLALDPTLRALLENPTDTQRVSAANAYLEAAQQSAQVSAAFLINPQGITVAASNWRLARSFMGQDYSFRPYFRDALDKGLGRFYGVGVTTGEPGYFLAVPIRQGRQTLGVVVVKQQLDQLEQALSNSADPLLLVDGDGIVFLASLRTLHYRSLRTLNEADQARLAQTRQYGNQPIPTLANTPLKVNQQQPQRVALPGEGNRERLVMARPVGLQGWQLVHLGSLNEARNTAATQASAVALACAMVLLVMAHLRHRARRREELMRVHASLEQRIAERTADLSAQIAELETTKAILRETQDAAMQAGKLAMLGQMSAGITHELNQPLAALQTFADNARALLDRGRLNEAADNLRMISGLVGRTGRIVRQLKTFSRKEAPTPTPVSLDSAIEHALLIVEPRRRELNATVSTPPADSSREVMAESGRLEQVLVNLIRNGLDAMAGQDAPMLTVECRDLGKHWGLAIGDSGPGLSAEALNHLFEPFFTTKPSGEGLGLGLTISRTIAESYGGTLQAQNRSEGGAEFLLTLPKAPEWTVTS